MFHVKHQDWVADDVSRETWGGLQAWTRSGSCVLDDLAETTLVWNERVNVVSRGMNTHEMAFHQRHSLMVALAPAFARAATIYDLGSGGGLPGIPLALRFPEKRFVLVDAVEKKTHVMRALARSVGLRNVEVLHSDIRNLDIREGDLLISKHAFKLPDFARLMAEKPWNEAVFLKGADYIAEADAVPEPWLVRAAACSQWDSDPFFSEKYILAITRNPDP